MAQASVDATPAEVQKTRTPGFEPVAVIVAVAAALVATRWRRA